MAARARTAASDCSKAESAQHPLTRSLERLLAALEARAFESEPTIETELIEATESMAAIVEGALVETEDDRIAPQWSETRKLMEEVCVEAANHDDDKPLDLRILTEAMPAEICARTDLLKVGLAHLVAAARHAARGPGTIELRYRPSEGTSEAGIVNFVVAVVPSAAVDALSVADEPGMSDARALSESIAADVAQAHGGELVIEAANGPEPVYRLCIPRSV